MYEHSDPRHAMTISSHCDIYVMLVNYAKANSLELFYLLDVSLDNISKLLLPSRLIAVGLTYD